MKALELVKSVVGSVVKRNAASQVLVQNLRSAQAQHADEVGQHRACAQQRELAALRRGRLLRKIAGSQRRVTEEVHRELVFDTPMAEASASRFSLGSDRC